MKIKNKIVPFLLFAFISIVAVSCKKSDRDKDDDTSAARDNAIAENVFAGIFKSIGEVVDSTMQLRISSCVNYSISPAILDTTTWPKTLTIDYGTSNCLCTDGNYRRGIITATFSGKYRNAGTVINITLTNYYHNDNPVHVGLHTITNNGRNASGNLTYSVVVQNASVTTNGGTIYWNSSRTREWIAGETTTFNPLDDVYSITGSASGTGINANTFTAIINTPLIVALNCAYIEKGSMTLIPANLSQRTIDFGSGACDNQATITINGVQHVISY